MACGTGKVYSNVPFPTINGGIELNFISEAYMDTYPDLLAGMPCDASRQYLIDNQAAIFTRVVKNGSVFPRPDASNTTMTGEGAGYQVYIQPMDGPNDIYGTWTISSVDGVDDQLTWPGPWPIVIGVDALQVYFNRVASSGNPNDGFTLDAPCDKMIAFDFNSWWCCAAAARGCTEGCNPPAISTAPRFLIPRPAIPEEGEENVSTPPLYTPLSLSNYTFQFIRDFGRVK